MSLNPEPISESPFEIIYDRLISTSTMHPLDGNVNTVDRKTQQAIGVVLNHQTKSFSNLRKFNHNKVKRKNLSGRSLDFFNKPQSKKI